MINYKDLLQKKSELDLLITESRERERQNAISRAREIVQLYRLTPKDIFEKKRNKQRRIFIPPKYYDPATGASWCGVGKAPAWIKDKDRAEFAI